jgi:hypothetical protein
MVPAGYTTPAAVFLVVGGLLSCFAGYRLFRVVLGLYGFILGAAVTTSMMGATNMFALVVAAVVGGLVGAVLAIAAYFIGVALIGGGLTALALNSVWHPLRHSDPPTVLLVIAVVLGALVALSVVRYVVIFGTALAGSWTTIVGAAALNARLGEARPMAAGVWVLYPLDPLPGVWWAYTAWIVLAAAGAIVQFATTSKLAGKKTAKTKK